MKRIFILLCLLMLAISTVFAQKEQNTKEKTTVAENKIADPSELAKKAFLALGGDKYKNLKNLIIKGSADVSASPTQTLPAAFTIVYAGEKYRIDIQAPPVVNFKQLYDGQQTYTSVRGMSLPPLNRLGLPLLMKIDDKGFVVSALPEKFKKKRGFRVTSPEGYYTDFIVDDKTNLVKEYEASYDFNGIQVTTSVAIDKYKEINGILINEKFSQRLEMSQLTYYADFKAKDILIDTQLADDVFRMEK